MMRTRRRLREVQSLYATHREQLPQLHSSYADYSSIVADEKAHKARPEWKGEPSYTNFREGWYARNCCLAAVLKLV